jgi:hypothetical protein
MYNTGHTAFKGHPNLKISSVASNVLDTGWCWIPDGTVTMQVLIVVRGQYKTMFTLCRSENV